MSTSNQGADDLRYRAATLAFAMLRFEAGAAHPRGFCTPLIGRQSASTSRGFASLILLDELRSERHAWLQKALENQQAGLANMAEQLTLTDDSRVLLQFDEEQYCYELPVLQTWCKWYGVQVGWAMRPYVDDDRARARLMLHRSDGVMSWGGTCPVRDWGAASRATGPEP